MESSELLQPFFLKRAAACLGLGCALFAAVWLVPGRLRSALTLAALGGAWIACHVSLSVLSGIYPPREASDWLVFGSGALVVAAGAAAFHGSNRHLLAVAAAVLLTVTFWLVLRRIPYLLAPGESPGDRQMWTLYGLGAVLVIFAAAEWLVRGLPALAVTLAMAVFASAAGLGLWKLASQDKMYMRPVALGVMFCGAGLAAVILKKRAVIPPGWAGWCAGGVFILFVRAGLSRADSVPLQPIAAAAAAVPAAALFMWLWRRLRLGGNGFAAVASVLMAGAGIYWFAAAEQTRIAAAPPAPVSTGADDTGAYDGL